MLTAESAHNKTLQSTFTSKFIIDFELNNYLLYKFNEANSLFFSSLIFFFKNLPNLVHQLKPFFAENQ